MMKKRRITQVVCALLYNCNFTGFMEGTLYQGNVKGLCVPGLNCYSCPGAVAACPLGSIQSALVSSRYKAPYYALGFLLLLGALLGRFICGFLCPFGLIQELLHKIPTPKIKKSKWTRRLSWLKYAVLVIFVVLIPIILLEPGFCKYICPAGILEGGIPMLIQNEWLREYVGWLFTWKCLILVLCVAGAVFCYRFFCRFLCPLGAFYSMFNKTAVVRPRVNPHSCNGCGACVAHCKMDIKHVGDRECISCMDCKQHCPRGAISWGLTHQKPHDSKDGVAAKRAKTGPRV